MRKPKHVLHYLFLVFVIVFPQIVFSSWSNDPSVNNLVCNANSQQNLPEITSDGHGGAIIVWRDYRSGNDWDIYAQRINAHGIVMWANNGIVVCNEGGSQFSPSIDADGSGGALISWTDERNSGTYTDIYAQKINANGVAQWTANGVGVGVKNGETYYSSQIVSDGSGGAIVVWYQESGILVAQRVNASGVAQWGSNGIFICDKSKTPPNFGVVSDGNGGVVIAWSDVRNTNSDIYAQRLDINGNKKWTASGVIICNASGDQAEVTITPDGNSGAYIAWSDNRGSDQDIYAQYINGNGVVQWTANGVAVCTGNDTQLRPAIGDDGNGGMVICWTDYRNPAHTRIYAQRLNYSGVAQWSANGIAISGASVDADYPKMIMDGSGNAIILYNINEEIGGLINTNIYAQKVDDNGNFLWTSGGIAVNRGTNLQEFAVVIVDDNAGGAVVAWHDSRSGQDDIYAQRVYENGTIYGAQANEVIINEYDGDVAKGGEWFELLVTKSGGIDLTNWIFTDENPDQMSSPTGEGIYAFANSPVLSHIPQGVYIVVENGSGTDDTDYSDGTMTLYTANALIEHKSGTFDLDDNADNITLWYDDDGIWDESNSIGVDHVSYGTLISPPDGVSWSNPITGTKGTNGNEAYFSNGSNFNNDAAANWTASPTHTPGAVNPGQDDSSLPVELCAFTANLRDGHVLLRWSTASEINNSGFEIYRSTEEEGNYQLISSYLSNPQLRGAGNSVSTRNYEYLDVTVIPGNRYWYKLADVDNNGVRRFHGPISVSVKQLKNRITSISPEIPARFTLFPNFPNPFNPSTTIRFDLPTTEEGSYPVELIVYDIRGRVVKTLFRGRLQPGHYQIVWDATGEQGTSLTSGMYLCHLKAGTFSMSQKMILMK